MDKRVIGGTLAVIGFVAGVVSLLAWFIYQAWLGNLPLGFVNALGAGITAIATLILAVLTAVYVYTTRGMLEVSQSQVSAMRASYAPVIDVTVDPKPQQLELRVTNRGRGTATNTSIMVSLEAGDRGFRYVGRISRPIGEGEKVAGVSPRAKGTAMESRSVEEMESLLLAPTLRAGSEVHTLPDLLTVLDEEDGTYTRLDLTVSCTDVIEEREYNFKPLEDKALSTESANLQAAFRSVAAGTITIRGPPPDSLRDYFDLGYRRVRGLFEREEDEEEIDVSTYREDLEVTII